MTAEPTLEEEERLRCMVLALSHRTIWLTLTRWEQKFIAGMLTLSIWYSAKQGEIIRRIHDEHIK